MTVFNQRFDAIQAALIAFEAALTPQLPIALAEFSQQRLRLSRAVNEFLSNEWQDINSTCIAGVDVAAADGRRTTYKAFVDLRMRYSAHIAKWNSDTIARDWTVYREDCRRLIRGMSELLRLRLLGDVRAA